MTGQPRVVVLCCDGFYQRHLVKRLSEGYRVTGVVVRRERQPKGPLGRRVQPYLNPLRLGRNLIARWDRWRCSAAVRALREALFSQSDSCNFPEDIELEVVENINDPRAVAFVERHAPDIVCVNGTNLLREPMLALMPQIRYGIINLHTGLSPYTRGGNCNLYALLEGHPEWVGVTVHHIDPGIDSGDLIRTAQVPMEADDNYDMIDARTFHRGTRLLVQAVRQLAQGSAERVRQWEEGRLYLRRTGFVYDPFQRYQVNQLLTNGLVRNYLSDKSARDATVRLIGRPV